MLCIFSDACDTYAPPPNNNTNGQYRNITKNNFLNRLIVHVLLLFIVCGAFPFYHTTDLPHLSYIHWYPFPPPSFSISSFLVGNFTTLRTLYTTVAVFISSFRLLCKHVTHIAIFYFCERLLHNYQLQTVFQIKKIIIYDAHCTATCLTRTRHTTVLMWYENDKYVITYVNRCRAVFS